MNFRQVTICAAAALLAAAAGCRAHAPACNLPFEMPQVARPAIPSNTVSGAASSRHKQAAITFHLNRLRLSALGFAPASFT